MIRIGKFLLLVVFQIYATVMNAERVIIVDGDVQVVNVHYGQISNVSIHRYDTQSDLKSKKLFDCQVTWPSVYPSECKWQIDSTQSSNANLRVYCNFTGIPTKLKSIQQHEYVPTSIRCYSYVFGVIPRFVVPFIVAQLILFALGWVSFDRVIWPQIIKMISKNHTD